MKIKYERTTLNTSLGQKYGQVCELARSLAQSIAKSYPKGLLLESGIDKSIIRQTNHCIALIQ